MTSTNQIIFTGASLALTVPFIAWAFIVSVQYNTHKKLSKLDDFPGDPEGPETRNDDLEVIYSIISR
jgi:hypothetical protein